MIDFARREIQTGSVGAIPVYTRQALPARVRARRARAEAAKIPETFSKPHVSFHGDVQIEDSISGHVYHGSFVAHGVATIYEGPKAQVEALVARVFAQYHPAGYGTFAKVLSQTANTVRLRVSRSASCD